MYDTQKLISKQQYERIAKEKLFYKMDYELVNLAANIALDCNNSKDPPFETLFNIVSKTQRNKISFYSHYIKMVFRLFTETKLNLLESINFVSKEMEISRSKLYMAIYNMMHTFLHNNSNNFYFKDAIMFLSCFKFFFVELYS